MSDYKRNHWVPQGYLRHFACDPEKKRIWRFSKDEGDPERKRIDKVAYRHHLYTPRSADGTRDTSFEKRLSELERFFGERPWEVLGSDFVDLGWQPLRKMIALNAAVMFLRNPRALETTRAIHDRFVAFYKSVPELPQAITLNGRKVTMDPGDWPAFRDAGADDIKRNWIEIIGKDAAALAKRLIAMRWAVLVAEEPVFITSDHPVAAIHPSLEFKGVNDRQTSILFPISPTRVLSMDHEMTEPDGQYYAAPNRGAHINLLIWRFATEHMYSSRPVDLVLKELVDEADRSGFQFL